MSKIHIGKNGPERCNASVRVCPLGGEHFESMREAQFAQAEAALYSQPHAVTRPNPHPQVTSADYAAARDDRELSEEDVQRYLRARNYPRVVDAFFAKIREKDADGWSDFETPHALTVADRHSIALHEVMVDADRWLDQTDNRLVIPHPQPTWQQNGFSSEDEFKAHQLRERDHAMTLPTETLDRRIRALRNSGEDDAAKFYEEVLTVKKSQVDQS